jgi:AcrR family transcriptional regulator
MSTDVQALRRPRGRPRREAARAAIIDATLALLGEGSFQAATMDAIAARAGVGKNTIYRRWESKDELVTDALLELGSELDPNREGDPYVLLREHLEDQAREFADPRVGALLPGLLGELQSNPEFAAVWADRVVRPRRRAIVELLEHARHQGRIRDDVDAELIADLLIGPQFLRLLFPFGAPEVTERYPHELLDAIWRGISAPAPDASSG